MQNTFEIELNLEHPRYEIYGLDNKDINFKYFVQSQKGKQKLHFPGLSSREFSVKKDLFLSYKGAISREEQ